MRSPFGHRPGRSPGSGPSPARAGDTWPRGVSAARPPRLPARLEYLCWAAWERVQSRGSPRPDSVKNSCSRSQQNLFAPSLLGIHVYIYFGGGGRAAGAVTGLKVS